MSVFPAAPTLRRRLTCWSVALAPVLAGCATGIDGPAVAAGRWAPAEGVLAIGGLLPCAADPDPRLQLDRAAPVAVLVHGYHGTPSHLRPLAQALADRGLQTICFEYDDREMLITSANELARSIEALAGVLVHPDITIVGHSQGGLIARKALVAELAEPVRAPGAHLNLVTVAAPFAGTASARLCASTTARVLTLGIGDLVCRLVSGKKWYEITHASDFIRAPGTLVDTVHEHLIVVTDEAGSCRRFNARGTCTLGDYVVGVQEQDYPPVKADPRATRVLVKAGHSQIVGEVGGSVGQLVALMARHAMVAPDPIPRSGRHLVARLTGR